MFTDSFTIPRPFRPPADSSDNQLSRSVSDLYNDQTFYRAFLKDLRSAEREVVICSPFITKYRFQFFQRTLKELQRRNITVFIFTRAISDQEFSRRFETRSALADFEAAGAFVIQLPGAVHEKVAIIDREILWEGSLNILSQRESRELMRRTKHAASAAEIMAYLHLNRRIADGYRLQYERLCHDLVDERHRIAIRSWFILVAGVALVIVSWLYTYRAGMMEPIRTVWNIIQLLNTPIR